MALALPLLLLLLTGILQFGAMYNAYETVTDAARSGARELATAQGLTNACDLAVTQTLASADGDITIPSGDVVPSYPNAPDASGTSTPEDYCGSTNGTPCTPYKYDTSCDTNGAEVDGDEAQITISYSYTINVFGVSLGTLHLNSSASDAVE
jgi:TadE-like protein